MDPKTAPASPTRPAQAAAPNPAATTPEEEEEAPTKEEELKQALANSKKALEWAKQAPEPALAESLIKVHTEEVKRLEAELSSLKPAPARLQSVIQKLHTHQEKLRATQAKILETKETLASLEASAKATEELIASLKAEEASLCVEVHHQTQTPASALSAHLMAAAQALQANPAYAGQASVLLGQVIQMTGAAPPPPPTPVVHNIGTPNGPDHAPTPTEERQKPPVETPPTKCARTPASEQQRQAPGTPVGNLFRSPRPAGPLADGDAVMSEGSSSSGTNTAAAPAPTAAATTA